MNRQPAFPYQIFPVIVILVSIVLVQTACAPVLTVENISTPSLFPSPTSTPTETPSPTATATLTWTASPSATPRPLILVFYGDSVLKVGDASRPDSAGFSIIDPLKSQLPSIDQVIVENHGGHNMQGAFEHLQENTLQYNPDLVTLWWGMNDLNGCPGIFDRATNLLVPKKLNTLLQGHIQALQASVDALLSADISVIVITPIPVLGELPWSHLTPTGQLVWEDSSCDFNQGLSQLAAAQRDLVAAYAADGKPVYLVDAWQVYEQHLNSGKMYMDSVHPASHGAQLIADEWLRVFQSIELR